MDDFGVGYPQKALPVKQFLQFVQPVAEQIFCFGRLDIHLLVRGIYPQYVRHINQVRLVADIAGERSSRFFIKILYDVHKTAKEPAPFFRCDQNLRIFHLRVDFHCNIQVLTS